MHFVKLKTISTFKTDEYVIVNIDKVGLQIGNDLIGEGLCKLEN